MNDQWAADLIRLIPQLAFAFTSDRILAVNESASSLGLVPGMSPVQVLTPLPDFDSDNGKEILVRLLGREVILRCFCRDSLWICAAVEDRPETQPVSASLLHTASSIRMSVQELNVALYRLQADSQAEAALGAVSLAQRSLYQLEHTASHLELFFRLSTGDYQPTRRSTKINQLFQELCTEAKSLLQYRSCPLQVSLLPSEHIGCLDVELITMMFWELISNAALHCDTSGIAVSLRRPSDTLLVLTVTNRSEADTPLPEHLFDRHAAPDPTFSGEKGPGFGLSLVSMAARLHGGSLVLSKDTDGTVRAALSIRLPNCADAILSSGRQIAGSGLNYGLISLSGWLPAEAFHPDALEG